MQKISVAGHRGLMGSAIWRTLRRQGFTGLIGKSTAELVLLDTKAVAAFFIREKPLYVFDAAPKVGVGSGSEISIKALSETVGRIVGFEGKIVWDSSRPDGTPRKLMDSSRIFALGWRPRIHLEDGIRLAYEDFCERKTYQTAPVSTQQTA